MVGFQTARNKPIEVSEEARARAAALLSSPLKDDAAPAPTDAAADSHTAALVQEPPPHPPKPATKGFGGFSNGHGKAVVITDAMRAKAAATIFSQSQPEVTDREEDEAQPPLAAAAASSACAGAAAAAAAPGAPPPRTSFGGFSNGNGKKVVITDAMRAKAAATVFSPPPSQSQSHAAGAPVDDAAQGLTALCYAAYGGHVAVVDELINAGADVVFIDKEGDHHNRPLQRARVLRHS